MINLTPIAIDETLLKTLLAYHQSESNHLPRQLFFVELIKGM